MKRGILLVMALGLLACGDRGGSEATRDLSGAILFQMASLCQMKQDGALERCPALEPQRSQFVRDCKRAAPWWRSGNCEATANAIVARGLADGR